MNKRSRSRPSAARTGSSSPANPAAVAPRSSSVWSPPARPTTSNPSPTSATSSPDFLPSPRPTNSTPSSPTAGSRPTPSTAGTSPIRGKKSDGRRSSRPSAGASAEYLRGCSWPNAHRQVASSRQIRRPGRPRSRTRGGLCWNWRRRFASPRPFRLLLRRPTRSHNRSHCSR